MKSFKELSEELKSGLSTKTLKSYIDKSIEQSKQAKEKGEYDISRKRLSGASKALDITGARIK